MSWSTFTRLVMPVAALLMAGCQKEEEKAPDAVRPVLSMVVSERIDAAASFAGTVQPKVQTELGFRVIGRLVARDVTVGDAVVAGAELAALDPTAFELALRSAKADLASAEATLANAAAAEERMTALLKTDTATQATVDSAQQSREAAQASLIRATAGLSKSEEQLSYTKLKSNFDGIVTATGAEVGQVVSAGEMVVTVARPGERDAVVDVPDGIALFPIGTPFSVSLQINPDLRVNGTVREIAPAADPVTRTRRVKIALDNPPVGFRLGTTITATRLGAEHERIFVPSTAVFEREGKSFVWIVNEQGGSVAAREVDVGAEVGGLRPVNAGLKPGERIATAGAHSLEEGQKVKISDGARS
ncbi:efflux RND transporter periplasmic adaptor subunit [Ensifer sp. 4252]|uniref:efflux RND transporter periplasmic adaptor subunit n=1 Tax=Ensifer sp. 4252 TaxID=3373915 RepID=UPI003D2473E9